MSKIEDIKSRLDIVDFISQYLQLRPAGSNFRATCPFHQEKTPSFMVSPEKQIWHCFGCGKGGDAFSFLMEMEGLEFSEALKILAEKTGVELDRTRVSRERASNKDRLLKILELSSKYYHFILSSKSDNQEVLKIKSYLADRGLNDGAIERWGIGYSLDNYQDLIKFLKNKQFTDREILLSGMSSKSEKGEYFNRFRNRIMFPIKDVNGRVIAFTARINPGKQDESYGKYINSPQTELYDKSKVLFALDRAKRSIKEKNQVVVVEGQMDAISAHEAGFENVIASSGTALTSEQLRLIKRYTDNLVLFFDQDSAGSQATDRGVLEALKMDLNLKIVFSEELAGRDPDDIIRDNPDLFTELINDSKHIVDYYISRELLSLNLSDSREKNKSVNKILTVISAMYNKVEQDFWIKEVGHKYEIEEAFLREQLAYIDQNANKINTLSDNTALNKKNDPSLQLKNIDREDKLMEYLFALILRFPHILDYLSNNLDSEYIPTKFKGLYELLLVFHLENRDDFTYNDFLSYVDKNKDKFNDIERVKQFLNRSSLVLDFYFINEEGSGEDLKIKARQEILELIINIKKEHYRKLIKDKERELQEAEKKNKSASSIDEILEDLKDINHKLLNIE